jgi:DNA (cytosine-5)-methyltransferase 1
MRVLDLFSGIGGFSLGLEACGMTTVAFCEQDGYARRVLKKHWPEAWIYDDVKTLTAKRLKQDGIGSIDLICGGFPCQDISCAGKGAGIEGARSGLWSEYARIIQEVRPRWVIAENVPALRSRGADRVLSDLERAGYTAWPLVVGALHAGAPHERRRIWIVANASSSRWEKHLQASQDIQRRDVGHLLKTSRSSCRPHVWPQGYGAFQGTRRSNAASLVCRRSDGVPARVDRLRCLGNAVVPQVVEMIGWSILAANQMEYA